MLSSFRILGWLEAASLIILMFIAMPLKYQWGMPIYVKWTGSIHGFLFVAYCIFAFYIASEKDWSIKKLLICVFLACLPFGTIYFDRKYLA